jgi:hypothetical protein
MGSWADPSSGLDGSGKSHPHRDSIPGPSSPKRVAIPTELSRPIYIYIYIYIYISVNSLTICTPHPTLFGDQIEKNEMGGACSTWGRDEVFAGFWWGNLRERDHLEDPGMNGRIILRCIFRQWDVGVWTGSMWLRIETVGRHL